MTFKTQPVKVMTMEEYREMATPKEASIHQQVVDYLKLRYPHVMFRTDFAAGIKMTIGQAVRHKRLQKCRAFPDITIFYPTKSGHALFIELKRSYKEVFTKTGGLKRDEHIQEQVEVMTRLTKLGYSAVWGFGFDHTKEIIDNWMND